MGGIFSYIIIVIVIKRICACHFGSGLAVQEGDAVGGGIHHRSGEGLAGVFGLVYLLKLLWMQLRYGESVGFEEDSTAEQVGFKENDLVPLSEILHKLPSPGRKSVSRLASGECEDCREEEQYEHGSFYHREILRKSTQFTDMYGSHSTNKSHSLMLITFCKVLYDNKLYPPPCEINQHNYRI